MSEYTSKNIVAFTVWKCKLCGDTMGRENIARHMHEHGLRCVEIDCNHTAYSPNFEYPSVNQGEGKMYTNIIKADCGCGCETSFHEAAPDMYEALFNLVEHIDAGLPLDEELDLVPARNALLKAEGRPL